jgi:hypothetical protein
LCAGFSIAAQVDVLIANVRDALACPDHAPAARKAFQVILT